MADLALARRMMVDSQLRTYDVNDLPLLDAVNAVPRERFVPQASYAIAYSDGDIAVSASRRMLAPMVAARMIQALEVRPGMRVLDVACGLGYTSAVMTELGAAVTALEDDAELAASARRGLPTATVVAGPLDRGHPDGAPYQAILVNGAVEREPGELLGQLADAGRLVCIVGRGRSAKATLYVRSGPSFGSRPLFDAAAPLLPAFRSEPGFAF